MTFSSNSDRSKENKSQDKQEICGQLDRLACRLRRMIYNFQEAFRELEEPYVTGILRGMMADAFRKYSGVLEMLDSAALRGPGPEKRLNVRRSALGTAAMTLADRSRTLEAPGYCVNISSLGLCVETPQKVEAGQVFDITVSLYEEPGENRFRGKVAWVREILPAFYICGIDFRNC